MPDCRANRAAIAVAIESAPVLALESVKSDLPDMAESRCVCNLNVFTAEQRARYMNLTEKLRSAVMENREFDKGFTFRMSERCSPTEIVEWIGLERRCCPFLAFDLQFEADNGPVWLRLSGEPGVKELIRLELSFLKD